MDAFMDKLAQKLTAQEMIKANAAADAAEMNRLKNQVSQYEELLREMRDISRKNTMTAEQVSKLAADCTAKLQSTDKVSVLIDESIAKIKEVQAESQDIQPLEEKLTELKTVFEAMQAEITEYVHKENVKVYRNVQAVVVEEFSKLNESIGETMKANTVKVNAVFGISIAAVLAAAAGVVLQMLTLLKII